MRKLVCTQCETIWYTANTFEVQKCDNCGGNLKEANSEAVVEEKNE